VSTVLVEPWIEGLRIRIDYGSDDYHITDIRKGGEIESASNGEYVVELGSEPQPKPTLRYFADGPNHAFEPVVECYRETSPPPPSPPPPPPPSSPPSPPPSPPEEEEPEGCGLAFWRSHPNAWIATGLHPNDHTINSALEVDSSDSGLDDSVTLMQALKTTGGNARTKLIRYAVAAALNALHPDVNFPVTAGHVKRQTALRLQDHAGGWRWRMNHLRRTLQDYVELGCDIGSGIVGTFTGPPTIALVNIFVTFVVFCPVSDLEDEHVRVDWAAAICDFTGADRDWCEVQDWSALFGQRRRLQDGSGETERVSVTTRITLPRGVPEDRAVDIETKTTLATPVELEQVTGTPVDASVPPEVVVEEDESAEADAEPQRQGTSSVTVEPVVSEQGVALNDDRDTSRTTTLLIAGLSLIVTLAVVAAISAYRCARHRVPKVQTNNPGQKQHRSASDIVVEGIESPRPSVPTVPPPIALRTGHEHSDTVHHLTPDGEASLRPKRASFFVEDTEGDWAIRRVASPRRESAESAVISEAPSIPSMPTEEVEPAAAAPAVAVVEAQAIPADWTEAPATVGKKRGVMARIVGALSPRSAPQVHAMPPHSQMQHEAPSPVAESAPGTAGDSQWATPATNPAHTSAAGPTLETTSVAVRPARQPEPAEPEQLLQDLEI